MFLIFLSMISRYIASYLLWSEEKNKKFFDITAFFLYFHLHFQLSLDLKTEDCFK